MKKQITKFFLLSLLLIFFFSKNTFSQTEDLFFSEYIEGSSNNKALEIFNGTGADIDLVNYQVWKIANGGEWTENSPLELSGILLNNDVFVICNSSSDENILSQMDLEWGQANFNGDDAIGLAKLIEGTWTLIDVIGEDGDDIGTGWEVAGIENATKDHTLIRKSNVTVGNINWLISAGSDANNSEWIVTDQDNFTNLGFHEFTGGGTGNNSPIIVGITISPENPNFNDEVTISANVTDDNEVVSVFLNWGTEEENLLNNLEMTISEGNIFSVTIPEQSEGATIFYQITATDDEDVISNSAINSYTVASLPSEYTIYQLQTEDHADENIITTGIVTAVFENENLYTIQDGTGEYSGIWVSGTNVIIGDYVNITGTVLESSDLTLITVSNFVLFDTEPTVIPEATIIMTGDLSNEAYEGVLVKVENAICTNPALGYGEWEVDDNIDSSGPCVIDDLGFSYVPTLQSSYDITGVVYFSYGNFKLEPRNEQDIIENITEEISLIITSPTENEEFTETNVEISFIVNNFLIGETTATDVNGHISYVLDQNEAVNYYENNPILLENLSEGEHTITLELLDNDNNSIEPAITSSVTFSIIGIPTLSIYEIQGQQETSPYVNETVTTSGTVTAVADNGFFMQNGEGAWNGIFVVLDENSPFTMPTFADEVQITGLVYENYDYTQIKDLSNLITLFSESVLPNALTITTNEVNLEEYESVLVKVENAICTNANISENYGKWELNDDSGVALADDIIFAYEPTLGNNYDITGVVDYAYDVFTINPRNEQDIIENITEEISLIITSPTENEEFTETNVEISFIVNNFLIGETTATDVNGHISYVLDQNEAVNYYENNPILLENLSEGEHTITLELLDNDNNSIEPAITSSVTFSIIGIPTLSIYEIQGQQETSPYVNETVTTSGTVTAVADNGFFMQNGEGAWNGIFVVLDENSPFTMPTFADEVQITGLVYENYDYTQIKDLSNLITLFSESVLPNALTITTNEVNLEEYESVLVKVENAICTNANISENYGKWELNDDSGVALADDIIFAYEPTLGNNYDITGVVDYAYDVFTINPRNENDIIDNGAGEASINIISPNGGETWYQGTTNTITWASVNYEELIDIVLIYEEIYSIVEIANGIENNGSFEWNIDENIILGNARIKISATENAELFDMSENYFTISESGNMPEVGDVIINEVGEPYGMINTYQNSYIELYNTTNEAIDIGNWNVYSTEVYGAKGDASFVFPAGTIIEANGFLIATRNRDEFLLNYTEVDASIVPIAESTIGEGIYIKENYYFSVKDANDNLIDETTFEVDWNSQVYEKTTPEADGNLIESWYLTYSLTPFEGTPGEINSIEPEANEYTINEIQTGEHFGEMVITNGIVTAVFENANKFTVQDGNGAYSGIWVNGNEVALGDEITLKGMVDLDFEHITLINASEIIVNSSENNLPSAEELEISQILNDEFEGVLIKVLGRCTSINPDHPENYGEWQITSIENNDSIRIDDIGIVFAPTYQNDYEVTGILNFSYGNYKIEPRDENDIESLGDQVPPLATSINVLTTTSIEIIFSEDLDITSAENPSNYAITGISDENSDIDYTITAILDNQSKVILSVSPEMIEGNYVLDISNIKDIAENQMTDSQDMPFTITDVSIDNVTAKAFEIYPNPVQNVLYFKNFNKIEKIEIYNTIGKVIFTNNGNRSHIDISNFEKGIYFIKINTKEKNIFIEKIIKN